MIDEDDYVCPDPISVMRAKIIVDVDYSKRPPDDMLNIKHVQIMWDEVQSLRLTCESLRSWCETLEERLNEKADK
jgi:hypothetical protein